MNIRGTSLKQYHTFAINTFTTNLVIVHHLNELKSAYENARAKNQPVIFLGYGSNVLFCTNFIGTVIIIRLKNLHIQERPNSWHLQVQSGYSWHRLVCKTMQKKIFGLENLAMIPGSVGAAAIQNIGAYGVEFKKFCTYVTMLDLSNYKTFRLKAEDCGFSYRNSILKTHYSTNFIIVAVDLKIDKHWKSTISYGALQQLDDAITPEALMETICKIRCAKLPDPQELGNAGSFFKNPIININKFNKLQRLYPDLPLYEINHHEVKVSAAWLIEKAGLKGYRMGNAAVHKDQPLVLVNLGKATSLDIIYLAKTVQQQIHKQFNILLEPEVTFIGAEGIMPATAVL